MTKTQARRRKTPQSSQPTDNQLAAAASLLWALADVTRLKILLALGEEAHNTTELAEITGMSQPTVSRHLSYLHTRGIAESKRMANKVFYRLAEPRILTLIGDAQVLAGGDSLDL